MDVRYINPFIASTKHVFKTMLKTEVMIGRPFLKEQDEPSGDVSAVIGLSGDAIGSVILNFPLTTAEKVAGTFAGTAVTSGDENFADALGELANMVAGQAKAQLDGLRTSISLPNVVVGKNHCFLKVKGVPRLCLPCDSSFGRFSVEVAMMTKKAAAGSAAAQETVGASS